MSHIDGNELVYYTDNNNVYSGGFNVNSIIKKQGGSPIMTLNNPGQSGGNVSDIFNNLAVPNWALSYSFLGGEDREKDAENEENEVISEELHEKLLSMIRVNEKNEKKEKIKSKKHVRLSNNKSKKVKHVKK